MQIEDATKNTPTTTTATRTLIKWYQSFDTGEWEGDRTPDSFLAEFANCKHAEVHENGDLYIEDPMVGHYADNTFAAQFVAWLLEIKAI